MKAVVFEKPNEMRVRDVAKPAPLAGQVLVRIEQVGICQSDFSLLRGDYIVPVTYPIVPGHEWVGIIQETGPGVTGYQVGDRVTAECAQGCNECVMCKAGPYTFCLAAEQMGFTFNGAMAEYAVANVSSLHYVPSSLILKQAALIEPFCVAYNAVSLLGHVDGADCVAVLGAGTIGLLTLCTLKSIGSSVCIVDPIAARRELALALGADCAVDPSEADWTGEVADFAGGSGPDIVIEATGRPDAMRSTFEIVRNAGRIAFVGMNIGEEVPAELGLIMAKGLQIVGVCGSAYVWDRAITLLERRKPPIDRIVTHEFSLEDADQAFDVAGRRAEAVKVHLRAQGQR